MAAPFSAYIKIFECGLSLKELFIDDAIGFVIQSVLPVQFCFIVSSLPKNVGGSLTMKAHIPG